MALTVANLPFDNPTLGKQKAPKTHTLRYGYKKTNKPTDPKLKNKPRVITSSF